jgi:hypothetical protein
MIKYANNKMRIKTEMGRKSEALSARNNLKTLSKISYCGIHNQQRQKDKRKEQKSKKKNLKQQ